MPNKKRRKKTINRIIIIWLLCLFYTGAPALAFQQDPGAVPAELREYDTDKLKELKDSGDFDYVEEKTEPPSLFRRIWNYFISMLQKIFNAATGTPVGKVLIYIGLGVLLLVVIIKILGINPRDVFYGTSDKGKAELDFFEENIHDLDFDQLLTEALSAQDYKLAIRLTYLKTLKLLSDRLLVDWEAGKTNYEYLNELKQADLRSSFKTLSYHFDYAWYGDFDVDEDIYKLSMQEAEKIAAKARKPQIKEEAA